jgi:hypothetical protein
LSYGMLDRSAYAPMTASTALQGDMAGRGIGMMVGGQDPMVAKQTAIDAIMQKYPDPDTPEELNAIANELGGAGFPDLALEVRNVGIELKKSANTAAANKLAANTPSDAAFTRLKNSLSNKMITKEMIHGYMQHGQWNSTDGSTYGEFGTDFSMKSVDDDAAWYNQYKYDFAEAKKELEGEIENWAIDYQATNPIKKDLNELLQSPDRQVIMFEDNVGLKGMTTAGKYLSDQTFVISSVKKKGLEQVSDDSASVSMDALSGATALPAPNLTNTGQTMAMNQQPKTWMDDLQEYYNAIAIPIQSTDRIV